MPAIPIAAVVLTAATLLFAAPPGSAQPVAGATAAVRAPAQRDPLDPRASVPPLRHRSALAGYRAPKDLPPTLPVRAQPPGVRFTVEQTGGKPVVTGLETAKQGG